MKWLLILLSIISSCLPLMGQEDTIRHRYPLFNGLNVSADVFSPVYDVMTAGHGNYGVMLMADLHHRFFPQVSAGLGYCNTTTDDAYHYKTKASPWFKFGMAYNFQFNEDRYGRDFYAAFVRYGFSHSESSLSNFTYADAYWGHIGPLNIDGLNSNSHWIELGAMIKVQVLDHLSLGWDVAFMPFLQQGKSRFGKPYFVPGYGTTASKLGFNFRVYYDIF